MNGDPEEERPTWCSQRKLREYYADPMLPPEIDAEKFIYDAVIAGQIRVRSGSDLLSREEAANLADKKWSDDPDQPYALPLDRGLSIEDAERLFREACG